MWRRWLVFIALGAGICSTWPTVARAFDDSGTISVHGTVPPSASSVTTALNFQSSSTSVAQDQELTYIISYSSSNAAGIPLTLQVEWEKGHIEGATEPSVEALEYVVGSASQAYGGTTPVVDTVNKRLTWEVNNLPAGLGTQTVSFKLRTTASYTGSHPVTLKTKLKVLSPVGIGDKTQTVTYRYQTTTASKTSASPSPAASLTPSPSPTTVEPVFETVAVRSVGKETARIVANLSSPESLSLRYGTSPTALTNQVQSSAASLNHVFTLENLVPETTYYFQVFNASYSKLISDVFVLTTSGAGSNDNPARPISINISHQRSLLFSGPTLAENENDSLPVPVMESGVLDLSLALSQTLEIVSVEVVVRRANVLGVTTDVTDEFQSSTTHMTKISPSVFVGKIKVPPEPGEYVLVAYVEDAYGNLTESELGKVVAVKPLTVRDRKTGQSIHDAKVELFVYNQQTKLYEVISNVSTTIDNPSYSDENGVVLTDFPPARYLAIISAPGYKEMKVEFEVDENQIFDFPQVQLESSGNFFIRRYHLTSSFVSREWLQWMSQFERLAKLKSLTNQFLVFQVVILGIVIALNSFYQRLISFLRRNEAGPYKQIGRLVIFHIIRFWFEFCLVTNLILSYFYWREHTLLIAAVFTLLAITNMILWLRFIWLRYSLDQAQHRSS